MRDRAKRSRLQGFVTNDQPSTRDRQSFVVLQAQVVGMGVGDRPQRANGSHLVAIVIRERSDRLAGAPHL